MLTGGRQIAQASDSTGLGETATSAGLSGGNVDIASTVGALIKSLLGFVGVIFLVLTIYAGFLWMTAAGNEEQITKAKKILTGSVIGMVIIFASYGITSFVINAVLSGTKTT